MKKRKAPGWVGLIEEAKRTALFANVLPETVDYATADLKAVIGKLQALDKFMAKRRKAKAPAKAKAKAKVKVKKAA